MAGQSNFQDVVQLNQDTLSFLGNQIQIGSAAGSKSIVFAQDPAAASAIYLVASNATGAETIIIPDANGTIGLITAISVNAAGGVSNGAVVFSNSNNITFGLNGSTITASASFAGGNAVSGLGVSTIGNTLGNTATTFGTIVFAGIGNITLSQVTAAGSNATITISGSQSTGPGAIAAGTQTGTSGTIVFSNSNNFTFGMSGSTRITASFGGFNVTAFSQWAEWNTNWSISNASFSMQKLSMPMSMSCTRANLLMALSAATNSSGSLTVGMAIYTINGATASLASSGSRSIVWVSGTNSTVTTASSQYGGVSGTRYFTVPVNFAMSPGDYLVGFWFSTSNAGTWRIFGRNGVNIVGSYEGDTDYFIDGTSVSSATSLLASFVRTDTNYARTGIAALRQPGFILIGTN